MKDHSTTRQAGCDLTISKLPNDNSVIPFAVRALSQVGCSKATPQLSYTLPVKLKRPWMCPRTESCLDNTVYWVCCSKPQCYPSLCATLLIYCNSATTRSQFVSDRFLMV
eukprot:2217180-Amphidinium_carterae.1